MQFGLLLPQTNWVASPSAIKDAAQAAEDLGFDAVSVHDHIQYNGWFLASGSRNPVPGGDQRNLFDAVATLAFVAGFTSRVRLLTSILLVPVREPILTANQLASIDQMSGGRLTIGVGVGPPLKQSEGETTRLAHHRSNAQIEYAAFGVKGNRGPLTDEYIEAMIAIWTQDPASYHGQHIAFEDLEIHPKPVQQPHIPIWVGGRSQFALERVVRLGQTWNPSQVSPTQFSQSWEWLDEHFAAAGRPLATERAINTYAVIGSDETAAGELAASGVAEMFYNDPDFQQRTLVGSPDRWTERLTDWQSRGLTFCELKPVYETVDDLINQMRLINEEIMPAFPRVSVRDGRDVTAAGLPERGHMLIRGATILSVDPDVGELRSGDIEVRGGVIVAIAESLEASGAEVIDARGTIAIPGFVDTHWHAWGTLLRGVVGDGPDHGWFATKGALGPFFTPEDTAAGARLGLAEGLASGITTVHDWAHNVLSLDDADANLAVHAELGLRTHWSYGAPSASPHLSAEQMEAFMASVGKRTDEPMDFHDIERVQRDWLPRGDGRLSVGVNVRGPSRSTPEVYRQEFARARELDLPIAMHCAGTQKEVQRIRQVEILASEGLLGDDVLLAHCNWLSADEQAMCAEHSVPVSVSPLVELRLAMGMPQISELRGAGVTVSLSLDTTAIAAIADPFNQMRVALGLENARHQDANALTPRETLRIATLEGARSLGLGDVTGSLTPGKRADIVLVRTDRLNTAPSVDPAVAVVHSAAPSNVDTVLADGRVVVRAGRLLTADSASIVAEAEERLARLADRAGYTMSMEPAVTAS